MCNKIIIAAAGSGKTTDLVDFALSIRNHNVLITTFTENNTLEITNKIIAKKRCVPSNITVIPWFSFLLKHWVRPFQGTMYDGEIKGLFLANGLSAKYVNSTDIEKYYFTPKKQIFSDKISRFAISCNTKSNGAVVERLEAIYDYILVDELQDITGEDLDILGLILESKISVLFVGDPRQSTLETNSGRKNKKFKKQNHITYFEKYAKKDLCIIDESSKNISYRCNLSICNLANKLYPDMLQVKAGNSKRKDFEGLYLVRPNDIDSFIRKTNAVQLRDTVKDVRVSKAHQTMNFGQSKGLTMDSVLIFPTNPMLKWLNGIDELKDLARCRLYIAITRARYCVGIVYEYDDNTQIEGFKKYL